MVAVCKEFRTREKSLKDGISRVLDVTRDSLSGAQGAIVVTLIKDEQGENIMYHVFGGDIGPADINNFVQGTGMLIDKVISVAHGKHARPAEAAAPAFY